MLATLPRIVYSCSSGKDAPKTLKAEPIRDHIWDPSKVDIIT